MGRCSWNVPATRNLKYYKSFKSHRIPFGWNLHDCLLVCLPLSVVAKLDGKCRKRWGGFDVFFVVVGLDAFGTVRNVRKIKGVKTLHKTRSHKAAAAAAVATAAVAASEYRAATFYASVCVCSQPNKVSEVNKMWLRMSIVCLPSAPP